MFNIKMHDVPSKVQFNYAEIKMCTVDNFQCRPSLTIRCEGTYAYGSDHLIHTAEGGGRGGWEIFLARCKQPHPSQVNNKFQATPPVRNEQNSHPFR